MPIDAYQVIMVMFSFGMFVLSLLSFVVKIVTELLKHKK
ncbi:MULTISPECIES: putative holin-like toxin [Pontibacillus]|nr:MULTISPECIES: putative holin-like toxin [Pontibacillus]WIF96471.1 putative holin-like toxin [Pontibacillus chungwhensis]